MKFLIILVVACLGIASAAEPQRNLGIASANVEKRVALVVGNASYKSGPLVNPVNDARAMAKQLRSLGFDVLLRENLKARDIGGVYREFRSKITPGGVALVFYAGHGVQFKGQNYFPAVDADISSEEDVPLQSLNLGNLLDNMEEAKAGVSLVFLDACRDNPFARRFRSSTRGLAKVEAASGTLIHYATRPGSVASDGEGKNGTYTEALLTQMSEPGVPVELMLKRVANHVVAKTKGKQEPWVEGSLRGDFYFIFQSPATVQIQHPSLDVDTETWKAAESAGTAIGYMEYLNTYPKGHFSSAARIKLSALQKSEVQPAKPEAVLPVTISNPVNPPGESTAQIEPQKVRDVESIRPDAIPTSFVESLSEAEKVTFQQFSDGSLRFDCGVLCSGSWGYNRGKIAKMMVRDDWLGVLKRVLSIGYKGDYSYYILAKAAEKLGFLESARIYYGLSVLETRTGKACKQTIDNCDGHVFPDEAEKALTQLNGLLKHTMPYQPIGVPIVASQQPLEWAESDNGEDIDWSGAKNYCASKGNGWGLPTVAELQDSYKTGQSAPCGQSTCKVASKSRLTGPFFWSSEQSGSSARFVSLNSGTPNYNLAVFSNDLRALCVRRP